MLDPWTIAEVVLWLVVPLNVGTCILLHRRRRQLEVVLARARQHAAPDLTLATFEEIKQELLSRTAVRLYVLAVNEPHQPQTCIEIWRRHDVPHSEALYLAKGAYRIIKNADVEEST